MSVRWHEVDLVVTIARAGSATAAATELGLSQSTVSRRLAGLESRLGVALFDRQAHRLVPTAEGAELVRAAEAVEGRMQDALRRIQGRDARPEGLVRVTALIPVLRIVLPGLVPTLRANPELRLELDHRFESVNIARGDADIAVRVSSSPPEGLYGRRVGRFAYALYRAKHQEPGDEVIAFPPPRGDLSEQSWLRSLIPEPRVRLRVGWDELHADAVKLGLGVAQLPCLVGDADPSVERVSGAPIEWGDDLWVLTHESLKQAARVRVVFDAIVDRLAVVRSSIEGEPLSP